MPTKANSKDIASMTAGSLIFHSYRTSGERGFIRRASVVRLRERSRRGERRRTLSGSADWQRPGGTACLARALFYPHAVPIDNADRERGQDGDIIGFKSDEIALVRSSALIRERKTVAIAEAQEEVAVFGAGEQFVCAG